MRRLAAFALVITTALPALANCPKDEATALFSARADETIATNPREAIELLTKAVELQPSNARLHDKLARAYAKTGDWTGAAREASHAAKLAPAFASYHLLRGQVLAKQGAWSDARTALEAAIAVDPRLADAHFELATTLEHLHDDAGALARYTSAIRLAPSRVEAYVMLADLYQRLGLLDQANAVAREGLTWSPEAHARFELATIAGAIASERGATSEALDRYREAREACGECREAGEAIAFFHLGAALAAKKPNDAEAKENLKTFQKRICRGGAAMRYEAECTQTQDVLVRLPP